MENGSLSPSKPQGSHTFSTPNPPQSPSLPVWGWWTGGVGEPGTPVTALFPGSGFSQRPAIICQFTPEQETDIQDKWYPQVRNTQRALVIFQGSNEITAVETKHIKVRERNVKEEDALAAQQQHILDGNDAAFNLADLSRNDDDSDEQKLADAIEISSDSDWDSPEESRQNSGISPLIVSGVESRPARSAAAQQNLAFSRSGLSKLGHQGQWRDVSDVSGDRTKHGFGDDAVRSQEARGRTDIGNWEKLRSSDSLYEQSVKNRPQGNSGYRFGGTLRQPSFGAHEQDAGRNISGIDVWKKHSTSYYSGSQQHQALAESRKLSNTEFSSPKERRRDDAGPFLSSISELDLRVPRKRSRAQLREGFPMPEYFIPRVNSSVQASGSEPGGSAWQTSLGKCAPATPVNEAERSCAPRRKRKPRKLETTRRSPKYVTLDRPTCESVQEDKASRAFSPIKFQSATLCGRRMYTCTCNSQVDLDGSFECVVCGLWTHAFCSNLQQSDMHLLTMQSKTYSFCCISCAQDPNLSLDAWKSREMIVSLENKDRAPLEFLREVTKSGFLTNEDKTRVHLRMAELGDGGRNSRGRGKSVAPVSHQGNSGISSVVRSQFALSDQEVVERAANVDALLRGEYSEPCDLGRLGRCRLFSAFQ